VATKQKSAGGSLVELVVIVAVALGLALGIQAFLVKPYRIPSESMVPTLEINQRVLVNRIGNNFTDPKVGEVMVFHPPIGAVSNSGRSCGVDVERGRELCPRPRGEKADVNFIKRVVAGPGDKISIRGGRVFRNGKPLDEPYAEPCPPSSDGCDMPGEITIPADHWYMMGDNRTASDDSRFWGPVPRASFIGNAFATYWPPNKIGLL
jgi:signal peptidase I